MLLKIRELLLITRIELTQLALPLLTLPFSVMADTARPCHCFQDRASPSWSLVLLEFECLLLTWSHQGCLN